MEYGQKILISISIVIIYFTIYKNVEICPVNSVAEKNKPRTAKVGAISKGDPSGFVKLQLVAKNLKKLKGGPFGDMKKFPKKIFKMRFLNSVTVPKNVKGGPFAIFRHPLCCKISKQMKGGPSGAIQKTLKSHSAEKSGAKVGSLVFSRLWTSVLFFLFVLDAFLRLELLRFKVVEVVEQMNKKVDLSCLKKTTHCNSRAHFLLKCAD